MSRDFDRRSQRDRLALRAWPLQLGAPDHRRTCGVMPVVLLVFLAGTLLLLAGCGGGGGGSSGSGNPPPPPPPAAFSVGGSVTGLSGASLVLQLNGGRDLTLASSGDFTFSGTLASGAAYAVTVGAQPGNPQQTCAVSNGSGTVAAANVTNVSISCTTNVYTVGGSVQGVLGTGLVLQNNDGDDLTVNADGAFVFANAVPSGDAYQVTVMRQPSNPLQVCRVANGGGSVTTAAITDVSITCEATLPRFAYVTNLADSTISIYRVEDDTGRLRHRGYALTGKGPRGLTLDPSFKFAYTANQASGDVSAFAVDAATGDLAPVPGSPFDAGDGPQSVVVHPSGRFAYVVNQVSDSVTIFRIQASGALGAIATARTGAAPVAMALGPQGKRAYVANSGSNSVSVYSVDAATGELKPVSGSPFAAGTAPQALAVDRAGRFVYVANADSKNVSVFAIEAATGALTPVTGSPFAAGDGPFAVALDPTGRFAYVSNSGSNNVTAFEIDDRTGALTELRDSPFVAGNQPEGIVIEDSGRYAYVANAGSDTVHAYRIDQNKGALGRVGIVTARDNPAAMAIVAGPKAVRVVAKFAYTANSGSGDVTSFSIDAASGALTRLGAEVASGSQPLSMSADPTGRFLYVANINDNSVTPFRIEAGGNLSTISVPVSTGDAPIAVAVDPAGRFAFVLHISDETISTFLIDAATGALTPGSVTGGGDVPTMLAVHPSGRFVYVARPAPDSSVSTFRVNPASGALTEVATAVVVPVGPRSLAIDPGGQFLYVATDNDVVTLQLDSRSGVPTQIAAVTTGDLSGGMGVDPSGRYVCVTDSDDNLVTALAIDQATGELASIGSTVAVGLSPAKLEFEGSGRFAYAGNVASDSITVISVDPDTGFVARVGSDVATGNGPAAIAIVSRLEQ